MTSTNQSMASPAAKAVYMTTELLESILNCLPAKDILRLSSVDRRTHAIIHRSPEALHGFIFEKTKTATSLEPNPLLPISITSADAHLFDCCCCRDKYWWSQDTWIAEIMHRRVSNFTVHGWAAEGQLFYNRLLKYESPGAKEPLEQGLRNVWHIQLDYLQRRANCRAKSSSWRNIWLSADKTPVEVHILGAPDFRCFYVRTLNELVTWGVLCYSNILSDGVQKWRLEMFGTPEKVIEELGLQNVDAVAPDQACAILKTAQSRGGSR